MNDHTQAQFIKSNNLFDSCHIAGVLLGGSFIFKHEELGAQSTATDWDVLILVEHKSDIVDLVNQHRGKLCEMFDVTVEEYANLRMPERHDATRFEAVDAVRFAGKTPESVKKSIKILSLEHLTTIFSQCDKQGRINILSYEDVRVVGNQETSTKYSRYIQQATRLNNNLVILHETDIFLSETCTKHKSCRPGFGVTSDLLLSGRWIHQDSRNMGDFISFRLFTKFSRIYPAPLQKLGFVRIFAKHERFCQKYIMELDEKLSRYQSNMRKSLSSNTKYECDNDCNMNTDIFWSNKPTFRKMIEIPTVGQNSMEQLELPNIDLSKMDLKPKFSVFSYNSKNGALTLSDATERVFWKQTDSWKNEVQAIQLAGHFYNRTQRPKTIDPQRGIILYPLFPGDTLAMMQLESAKSEGSVSLNREYTLENTILTIELHRAEDMLRAYCSSARMSSNKDKPSLLIHRFFHERLVNHKRFQEFYQNGINLPHKCMNVTHLTLEQLLNKSLNINGKRYGCLQRILEEAERQLNPNAFIDQLVVYGLGDAHSGNVLVSDAIQPNSTRDIIHIDYEVAGYHSPALDLAEYFFYDVFFNIFYADYITADSLCDRQIIQLRLEDDNTLSLELNLPKSVLSKSILEIKKRYMLLPFLDFIDKADGQIKMPDNWSSIFGYALFCCALLTKNFSNRSDIFFANLALGVILTGMDGVPDINHFLCFENMST